VDRRGAGAARLQGLREKAFWLLHERNQFSGIAFPSRPGCGVPRGDVHQPLTAGTLVRGPEFEKLSVYFNVDHGTGKIRGLYMERNEAVRPLFRKWLAPFADLGAETLSLATTGGTDHTSFDAIGLPAFQFIQDPIDYWTRTHHSNADVYERIQPDDMKQMSTILAAFVYNAAMADQKLARRSAEGN